MEFKHRGISLSVGEDEIRRIVLARLTDEVAAVPAARLLTPPRIGSHWEEHGGIYAGIVRGREGGSDTYLIIGPAYDPDVTWDEGMSYAKGLKLHGFADWHLFFRPEGAVAYANVPELFEGKTHWMCEQHAGYSSDAWLQYFGHGGQDGWSKDGKLRCRAVRSVIII